MNTPGRVAFRTEGEMWVAYWALPDTMDDAIVLGSIVMAAVQDPARKRAFMDLIVSAANDILTEAVGTPPTEWRERPAPASERMGSA